MFQEREQEFEPFFAPSFSPLNTEQEIMWGVWPSEGTPEETCVSLTPRSQRVRCATNCTAWVNPNSTEFDPDWKCVFKRAEATTATATCSSDSPNPCGALVPAKALLLEENLTLPRMVPPDLVPTQSPNSCLLSVESTQQVSPIQCHYSTLSPAQQSNSQELTSKFCDIINADNFEEFQQEVFTNYNVPAMSATIPFLDEIIESVKNEILLEQNASPACSSVSPSQSPSLVPTLTLSTEQPVKFVGDDGKEYLVVLQPVDESPKKTPKRKLSETLEATKPKRAPGISLVNMSEEEISERKKEQNRAAAQRYREKMKTSKQAESDERKVLTERNAYLRVEAERLEKEIASLRSFIFDRVAV